MNKTKLLTFISCLFYILRFNEMKKSLLAVAVMSLFLAACGGEKAPAEAAEWLAESRIGRNK